MPCFLVVYVRAEAPKRRLAGPGGLLLSTGKALARPLKRMAMVLALWLMSSTARAGEGCWDADYEARARRPPQQRADTARLRIVQHLLDSAEQPASQAYALVQKSLVLLHTGPAETEAAGRLLARAQALDNVLLNLCTNALPAVHERRRVMLPPGAVYEPTVTVSTRRPTSRQVEIRARDNGPCMPGHVKNRVFQPFFTTKPVGEGTGLGLWLSHDIVTKSHGGTLTVESHEGEGTEFLIILSA